MPQRSNDADVGEVIVHVFGRTDVGRVRDHNEDSFLVADLSADNASLQPEVRRHLVGGRGTLFMVADGLGGAAAGEIASELAVNTVYEEMRHLWGEAEPRDPETFARALKTATEAANAKIFAYALEHPEHRGLGTTATVAGLLGDTLYLVQVGDSRAYLVRDGVAKQITKDQSLMQRLVEAGELTQEEAERSERRNIILQALGPEPMIRVDLTYQQVRRGDMLVLCTDGLSGLVKKDEIAEVVTSNDDLIAVCKELIDRANENGGPDNITVITARFDGSGLADPDAEDAIGHAVYPLESGTATRPVARFADVPVTPAPRLTTPDHALDPAVPMPRMASRTTRAVLLLLAATFVLLAIVLAARQWKATSAASQHPAAPRHTDSTAPPAAQP